VVAEDEFRLRRQATDVNQADWASAIQEGTRDVAADESRAASDENGPGGAVHVAHEKGLTFPDCDPIMWSSSDLVNGQH
jgi:hypothetical protein